MLTPADAPESRVMTLADAVAWRETLRAAGKKLVVTNGCFDLLHRGHAEYLARSRALGDALLVLVNSDASVRALKGPSRPVVDEFSRVIKFMQSPIVKRLRHDSSSPITFVKNSLGIFP